MSDDLDFYYHVLDHTNLLVDAIYCEREKVRITLGGEGVDDETSYDDIIRAYLSRIDALRTSIARRELLNRDDLSVEQRAFIVELIATELRGLWDLDKK